MNHPNPNEAAVTYNEDGTINLLPVGGIVASKIIDAPLKIKIDKGFAEIFNCNNTHIYSYSLLKKRKNIEVLQRF
mgnify:CR=1 FL=1